MAGMDVEVLVGSDCPHRAAAVDLVREVLDELRLSEIPIRVGVIDTPDDAQRRGFVGSPTILLDGVDPFATPGQTVALACRIYRSEHANGPLPDKQSLREVVRSANVGG